MIKLICASLLISTLTLSAEDAPKQITSSSGTKMVLIPGGSFQMGSGNGKEDEKPVHKVTVDSFYMDVYEVDQNSFQELTGTNPSKFKDKNGPADQIRWNGAAKYCNARSKKEGLKPCYDTKTWKCDFSANGYRLPTEAEWEYACTGGKPGDYFFKGGQNQLKYYGWFRKNSREKVRPCGKKRPNKFGLYDIYGNVAEWCNDFYAADFYSKSPSDNPKGPATGKQRVLRGGSWASRAKNCRSAKRFKDDPVTGDSCQGYDTYGFRCVRKAKN